VPLTDRFQLLDLRRDEGARTFEAREIATGRPVLVHLFADPSAPLNHVLLEKIDALPQKEQARVIDRGEHEGGVYVVTDRLAEYGGLREWLALKPTKPLDAASEWRTMPVKASVDDQLANLFETGPVPQMPALEEPGEFTRQFAPVPRPVAPAAPRIKEPPGEFTRQFQPPLRPVPAPPAPVPQEGEFTQMLKAPGPVAPPKKSDFDFPPPMTPVPPMRQGGGGEFTQVFGPGNLPAAPMAPHPPAAPTAPAEATQVFRSPTPPAEPPGQGSGEWGRMFERPAPLTFGQGSGAPQVAPAPVVQHSRNSWLLPVLLIAGAVVLLAAAMIVYLVSRPHSA
jgi:hypothetical protein